MHRGSGQHYRKSARHSSWSDGGGVRPGATPQCPEPPSLTSPPAEWKIRTTLVKWPAANNKEWLQLDEDIDKIMETTGKGNVDHKLQAMCTFITTIGAERFGVTERPARKESARPNRREHKISQLRQELKTLKRQFRAASEEERNALSELRQILRRKLRRAEWHRRKGKERAKKRKAFITNPFSFTKRLLGQKKSGSLTCPVEEINHHLNITFSDPLREQDLGPCEALVKRPEPVVQFNTTEPTLKEAVMAARSSSSPGPSGVPYRVYKQCPKLLVRLWKIRKVIWRRGRVTTQWRSAEGVWIPKEEDASNIEQFRIISLLCVEGKIFFKIVSERLTDFLLKKGYIDTSLVETALTRHHVPGTITNLILDYYNDFQLRVTTGSLTPAWQRLEKGIITGCTILVPLFSLAMDMIVKSAEMATPGARAAHLLGEDELLAAKSRSLVLRKGKVADRFRFALGGTPIPTVMGKRVKSLGKVFNSSLRDSDALLQAKADHGSQQ
ncbi:hypothetical protein D4764_10G0009180 [Takifugu flavidus]|uniref:Reverse transcriptase domain-containing protein n=1 Tax=Takifugu flavidus TaxID=433684 RepID=A0A5C6PME7_9TELE|nr:hypothetical protein D4764_10G0009180 [Takifugu flavidus]